MKQYDILADFFVEKGRIAVMCVSQGEISKSFFCCILAPIDILPGDVCVVVINGDRCDLQLIKRDDESIWFEKN